jgi:hypothetical protein
MSAANQTPVDNVAAEIVIDEASSGLTAPANDPEAQPQDAGSESGASNMVSSAPEIAPSPEAFERLNALRTYRGAPRTECDDPTWDALRAALKFVATRYDEYADEGVGWICESLLSLQQSRPAERLFLDFCECAGYGLGVQWWEERKSKHPTTDFKAAINVAFCNGWQAMSDPPPTPASRFTPVVPNLTAPPHKWIVKGVIPERAIAVVYGRWGSGKSSVAIDLCAAVARGTPWHGHKVRQGIVVYIASENAHGFRARLNALLREQGITLDDLGGRFLEITGRPHLLKPDEVQELITELKTFGRVSTVVVDTLARATAGADENAAKEMGILVENCQTIVNATGASVVLVHHTGKDESRGMRGSSSLPAAADTEIVIDRPDDAVNFRTVRLGKQRDAADYCDLFSFELKIVELGVDEDGDKITSTVVHEVAPASSESAMTVTKLSNSPTRRVIRGVLGDAMRPMDLEDLKAAAKAKLLPPDPGSRDRRHDTVRQTLERMILDKEVHVDGQLVSLASEALAFKLVPEAAANDLDPNDDLTFGGAV